MSKKTNCKFPGCSFRTPPAFTVAFWVVAWLGPFPNWDLLLLMVCLMWRTLGCSNRGKCPRSCFPGWSGDSLVDWGSQCCIHGNSPIMCHPLGFPCSLPPSIYSREDDRPWEYPFPGIPLIWIPAWAFHHPYWVIG